MALKPLSVDHLRGLLDRVEQKLRQPRLNPEEIKDLERLKGYIGNAISKRVTGRGAFDGEVRAPRQ